MSWKEITEPEAWAALDAGQKVESQAMSGAWYEVCVRSGSGIDYMEYKGCADFLSFRNRKYRVEVQDEKVIRHEVSADGDGGYMRAAHIRLDMWVCRPDCAGYEFAEWPDIIFSSPMRYVDGNGGRHLTATAIGLQSGIRKLANLVAVWQRAKD